jgi:hypothetical protein
MRIVNRLLALVVGLALAAAAAVAIIEMVTALTGNAAIVPRERWASVLAELRWDDPTLVAAATGLVLAGLVLLGVELTPARPRQFALRGSIDAAASIDRRGLQERLRHVALRDADVVAADVRIRRRAKVRASVPPDTDRRACRQRVLDATTSAIDELGLTRPPTVRAQIVKARERVR